MTDASIPRPRKTSRSGRKVQQTKAEAHVFETSEDAASDVAMTIAALIRKKAHQGDPVVLGLPTGSTPVGVYRELIRMHNQEGLDFSNCFTFNLDEYCPIQPDALQSYHRWMDENFFNAVNIPQEQRRIPRGDFPRHEGDIPRQEVADECAKYERKIDDLGLDLVLLGIGRSGHIGFNEPGSPIDSGTRLVTLDSVTRKDAAEDFFGEEHVPLHAITMGVGTILKAHTIIVLALGEHKADIVRQALEGPRTDRVVASFLQGNVKAEFILDEAAASELTANKTPWLVGPVSWTSSLTRKAVLWLSFQLNRPLLELEDVHFREHGLHELLGNHGSAESLCQSVFNDMMATICPHPAGLEPKDVLVLSPHPDDDVISMGGTLIHLVADGHRVHVAYMTSGNVAVFDFEVLRFADFVAEYCTEFGIDPNRARDRTDMVRESLRKKRAGQVDDPDVQFIKALIRKTEAKRAAGSLGIPEERLHFLNMPFYQTGSAKKRDLSPKDVTIVQNLLRELRPQQVYVAGELSDPHGTHRMCALAIYQALDELAKSGLKPDVWLYRGAWQEWEPHEIEQAVPMSPSDVRHKREAIFKHQSQKDYAMYPGHDPREFWQRAQERNRHTAEIYKALGLPAYHALEAFVRRRSER